MKILTTLAIVAIAAVAFNIAQAQAESCEGGTLQTGDNGHVYCQSNNKMNWWSAYTWCQAQGRHLASMYEVCPTWDGSTGGGKICNLNSFSNNEYNWTTTASSTENAFIFDKNTVLNDSVNQMPIAEPFVIKPPKKLRQTPAHFLTIKRSRTLIIKMPDFLITTVQSSNKKLPRQLEGKFLL